MAENFSPDGRAILKVLVDHTRSGNVDPTRPKTFISYKKIHDILNLPLLGNTYGNSLSQQGLKDLVEWADQYSYPAITGLIISESTSQPSKGYFEWYKKSVDDFTWWIKEIEKFNEV